MRTTGALGVFIVAALTAGGCGAAHPRLDAAVAEAPRTDGKAESEFNAALELVARLQYAEAAAKLLPLVDSFNAAGNPRRAAEAAFWSAYCHERQGRWPDALRFYELVIRDYPQSRAARHAAERIERHRE